MEKKYPVVNANHVEITTCWVGELLVQSVVFLCQIYPHAMFMSYKIMLQLYFYKHTEQLGLLVLNDLEIQGCTDIYPIY